MESRLSEEEMIKLIVDLKKNAREAVMRKHQELIVRNAEEAAKFLQENKHNKGVKTTESGIQYKVVKAGRGITPKPEDMVTINYRGTFTHGTEFDSSYAQGEPITVQADGVIRGWTGVLQIITKGISSK